MATTCGDKGLTIRAEFIGILIALVIQTFAAVWWASKTENRILTLENNRGADIALYQALQSNQVRILQDIARIQVLLDQHMKEN